MKNSIEKMKSIVREKYGLLAAQPAGENAGSCCGPGCGCSAESNPAFADSYKGLAGYYPEADLSLGCGIPTEVAAMNNGDVVLDLGSGAGNDVFVARGIVGERGRVIGVDMTEAMVERATRNNKTLGYTNVEFRLGEIEKLPVDSNSVDVAISNCVLNLVPNKRKAFAEIMRILKPHGHFSISDIVTTAPLPPSIQSVAELQVGCVAGALTKEEYLQIISETGFHNVSVRRQKNIVLPEKQLREVLTIEEFEEFEKSKAEILSITVYGEKALTTGVR